MSQEGSRSNRLAAASSPYLLLHQHNPVDWYPWGEEALTRAREEDRPIFLSVGYSTCYWCHVMERESFSDPGIAEMMNRDFVNIKVDREERPDLDEIYMVATQVFTQRGGWPNSLFLTPDLEPFYAGTYFPPEDRQGLPGFPTLLRSLASAWRERRAEVASQAASLAQAMRGFLEERVAAGDAPPGPATAERSLAALAERFDPVWGGFGGAPKFPTPSNLFQLLEFAAEREDAARMLSASLDQMARGGIYDQLGGGFHRYATDREWKIPHFEKMLYDNGLLLELYAREWERTSDPEAARVARETAAYLGREMTSAEGAFFSAQDAETDGHEGAFYVWTRQQLIDTLGEEDFGFLAPLLGFDGPPFFEGSEYVLHLPRPLAEQAERRQTTRDALLGEMAPLLARLLARREERKRMLTDDKILADWNGMAIAGLAVAGRLLGESELVERAVGAADFVLATLRAADGDLLHAWRGGKGEVRAFLSDYAFLARGALALGEASGDDRWLEVAASLTHEQTRRLGDERGGFFVAAESPEVLFRSKEVFDGAVPGSNAVAALNLIELAAVTGEKRWRSQAEAALRFFAPLAERHPDGARTLTLAARRYAETVKSPAGPEARDKPGGPEAEALAVVAIESALGEADAAGRRELTLRLEIADGWHLYAPGEPQGPFQPVSLDPVACELEDLRWPAAKALAGTAEGVYEGAVEIRGRVRADDFDTARLRLIYQPCDAARCLLPVSREIELAAP